MKKYVSILIVIGFFMLLVIYLGGRGSESVNAASAPLTPHQIGERNKPGVVMIYTVWKTHIVVPEPDFDQSKVQLLISRARRIMREDNLPQTEQGLKIAAVREALINFLDYVKPGNKLIKKDVETGAIGTGFIITPDGYVVTNAHVVYAEDDFLKWQLTQTALKELIAKDVEEFLNDAGELDVEISEETMNAGIKNASIYYRANMELDKVETSIFTEMGVAVPGLQATQRGFGSDVRKRGEPIPGKDVAILKIDKTNLPTVTVGDDTALATGDNVFVMGYPGAATFHELLSAESQIEPTLTSGLISAKKTMKGGWTVFQTDAAMTHGNSGGPVFNDRGEVVGIATFGSVDYQTGNEIQGLNFMVPISIAKEFLREINVTPTQSSLTKTYWEGLSYYDSEHFSSALERFREVNELNPGFPYVQGYITQSRTAINEGRDKASPVWIYVLAGVGVLFLAAMTIGGILFLRSRKHTKKPNLNVPVHP